MRQITDTIYSRALADEVCRRISEGESVRSICRDPGMPSEGTVRGWSWEDRDGFAARHRLARELQLEYWADEIIDLADQDDRDPRCRQIRIDTRKWLMSKLAPRRYGDRLLHASDPENPVRVLHEQVNLEVLSSEQLDAVERLARAMLAEQGGR